MADPLSGMIQIVWISVYVSFVLTTGWVIMKGFRGYLPWYMKLLGRLGFGFIALVCSISLAPSIPLQSTGIFKIVFNVMQINMFVAGIISTAVLVISLFLISNKIYNTREMEKQIGKMKMKLEKAKASDKEMEGKTPMQKIMQPKTIAGIAIFAAFLAFALINFRGFPDPVRSMQNVTANTVSDLGMSMDDIRMVCQFLAAENQNTNIPEGCVSPLELVQNFQQAIVKGDLPIYADSGLRNVIQARSSETVAVMYRVEYKQRVYALAITDKQNICTATGSQFCGCLSAGAISG